MKIEELVAVSGFSGIFRLAANRSNGLIVEDLDNGKKRFAPARKHQFTPLASIGIFTYEDSTELKIVFKMMEEQLENNPTPPSSAKSGELHDYFRKILADYDEDRVHTSDIKKVIKWFTFLQERNLLDFEEPETEEAETTEESATETTESTAPETEETTAEK